ncbi:MAG: hypothetical protein FJ343_02810 [Sphingomonadales bacterium]|nr:hypothetical protein [Sphingomonadales bacterium]
MHRLFSRDSGGHGGRGRAIILEKGQADRSYLIGFVHFKLACFTGPLWGSSQNNPNNAWNMNFNNGNVNNNNKNNNNQVRAVRASSRILIPESLGTPVFWR